MSNDSIKKTVIVALGVCLVCSILVSTAAVALKPRQERNKRLDKIKNILQAAALYQDGLSTKEVFAMFKEKVEPALVDLKNGTRIAKEEQKGILDPETYDLKTVAKDSKYGQVIPGKNDIAGIKRMPKVMLIYFVKEAGHITQVVFPVYGKGLWSTMYGFIALDKDLKIVKGFTFYEHGETPGLGGEVDNPNWKALWKGKVVFDQDNKLILDVIKSKVTPGSDQARYTIDGLAGATLTTYGVKNMIRFWFGDFAYAELIKKLREEASNG